MTTLDCRLFCAASTAYGIQPDEPFAPRQPFYDSVGFLEAPTPISGGANQIDACLVGRNPDGIIVAFRGTLYGDSLPAFLDWWQDIAKTKPVVAPGLPGKVHEGFYSAVQAIQSDVTAAVRALVSANPGQPLFITGHSKGGPMASIYAKMLSSDASIPTPTVVTFASPRPGDATFASGYGLQQTSYENYLDLVPFLPPSKALIDALAKIPLIGWIFDGAEDWNYQPVGKRMYINASGEVVDDSPLLDDFRLAEITKEVLEGDLSAIMAAHCSACQGEGCAGGYARGVCQGSVCGCSPG